MVPDGWTKTALQGYVHIYAGLAPGNLALSQSGPIPYVKVEDLNNCDKYQTSSREYLQASETTIPAGTLIFPKRGAAIFSNKIRIAAKPMVLDTNLMGVEAESGLHHEFLYYAIDFAGLYSLADTSTIPQLNNKHVYPFQLLRPQSKKEQARIAKVLATWDLAITATENLLANSRRQKQDLMQGLLTGHRYFGSRKTRWSHPDFDHVFERITRKNTAGNQNVLTISGQHGLISQREFFNKSVASENLQGYTLLERGDFAYNKSYSSGYPVGAIKPLLAYASGVVSSLYICFRIRPDVEADADFFRHYFEAGMLNDAINGIAQEGARNHGLLNVSVKDFFKLKLRVPAIEAQQRIAEVLNSAESEERCIAQQLAKLKREKRALMAELLTGKRRVSLPEAATEVQEIA